MPDQRHDEAVAYITVTLWQWHTIAYVQWRQNKKKRRRTWSACQLMRSQHAHTRGWTHCLLVCFCSRRFLLLLKLTLSRHVHCPHLHDALFSSCFAVAYVLICRHRRHRGLWLFVCLSLLSFTHYFFSGREVFFVLLWTFAYMHHQSNVVTDFGIFGTHFFSLAYLLSRPTCEVLFV